MRVRPFRAIKFAYKILYARIKTFGLVYFWRFTSRFRKTNKELSKEDWEALYELVEKMTAPLPEGTVIESSLVEVEE